MLIRNHVKLGIKLMCCIGCFILFVLLSLKQIRTFSEGRTSVSTSWNLQKEGRSLPSLVFCHENGFISNQQTMQVSMASFNLEEYDSVSKPLDIIVRPCKKCKNTVSLNSFDLYTLFMGRCKAFHIDGNYSMNQLINFHGTQEHRLFLFPMSKGYELAFAINDPIKLLNPVYVTGHKMVKLNLYRTVVETTKSQPCSSNIDQLEFHNCKLGEIGKQLIQNDNVTCIPEMFAKYFHNNTKITCPTNFTQTHSPTESEALHENVRREFRATTEYCLPPCTENSYGSVLYPLSLAENETDNWKVFITYASDYSTDLQEYIIVDGAGLFAGVGGGLGLLLGFSVFNLFEFFIDKFFNVYSKMKAK